jgi:hypothetical protein
VRNNSTVETLLNWVEHNSGMEGRTGDINYFGRLLLTLFAGSHPTASRSASTPTGDIKLEMYTPSCAPCPVALC